MTERPKVAPEKGAMAKTIRGFESRYFISKIKKFAAVRLWDISPSLTDGTWVRIPLAALEEICH